MEGLQRNLERAVKIIDQFGNYFSDGMEGITRALMLVGDGCSILLGGTAMLAFTILMSPIILLGWILNRLGFKPEWR